MDRTPMDQFGWSIAVNKEYIFVGVPQKSLPSYQNTGAVYVFKKQVSGKWKQTQKLQADSPNAFDFFGGAVSTNDDYAIVGAAGDDNGTDKNNLDLRKGSVYVFKKNNIGKWIQIQKLSLKNSGVHDGFGYVTAMSSKFIAISALGFNVTSEKIGAVFIYALGDNGGWELIDTIIPPKNSMAFGRAISISDSLLVIGHQDNDGIAYIYTYNDKKWRLKNEWAPLNKYLGRNEKKDCEFGNSVCACGEYILVGASGEVDSYEMADRPDTDSIMFFVVQQKNGFKQIVVPNKKRIRDSLKITPKEFKASAKALESLNSRELRLAGAGAVYVYKKDVTGKWLFHQRVQAADKNSDAHFGNCLAMTDSLIVIGAFGDKLKGSAKRSLYAGAAYVFSLNRNGQWLQMKKLTADNRHYWDKFGFSAAACGKTIVVGSRFEEENEEERDQLKEAGAVYIYEKK